MSKPRDRTEADSTVDKAVALRYTGEGAPRVVAKGVGEVAERIREAAANHGVALRQDDALVELLASVELGEEIPESLYVAVAQLLVFVYALSGRTAPRRPQAD